MEIPMAARKTPKPQRTGKVSLQAYVDEAIHKALSDYVAASDPKTSNTAVIESALRKWLEPKGFWPPSGEGK